MLDSLAIKGFRVIAMGSKTLNETKEVLQNRQRNDLEFDIHFLGFLVFQNKLKPDTAECMRSLMAAKVNCKIITGDNPFTAI
jgi:cation-transporting ATPase 13A3/4/5